MKACAVGALGLLALSCLGGAFAAEPGEGGAFLSLPLDVELRYPPDGSGFAGPNLTAVIEADGDSVGFFWDDFKNGTFVNATLDASGVRPNASAAPGTSSYTSPTFLLPADGPGLEWSQTLEYLTSNSSANLSVLLDIEVHFGDRTDGRNWSAWVPATADGSFGSPVGPSNQSLRNSPSLQYRFTFLDPANASNPHLSQMELWFLVHIGRVEARLAPGNWTVLGTSEGRYNFSVVLPAGNSLVEARVTDVLGATKLAHANVTYDTVRPTVLSAPQSGSSIPPDQAAVFVFSEPIDAASASVHLSVAGQLPVDLVWSNDNTTLFVSAQNATKRGPVTIVIGSRLRDRVGNEIGQDLTYTLDMGKAPEPVADITPLLVALFALIGGVGIVVLLLSKRAKARKQAHAKAVIDQLAGGGRSPPLD